PFPRAPCTSSTSAPASRPSAAWPSGGTGWGSGGETLPEMPKHRPGAVGGVRDHGIGEAGPWVMHTHERHPGILPDQHHLVTRLVEEEPEPAAPRLPRPLRVS